MPRKLYIKTYGCQMNEYDSTKMSDVLAQSDDLVLVDNPEEPDVLLPNTCSIREKAQDKVFSLLGTWKSWKKRRPDLVIGVGGCVASQEGDTIRKRAPHVDMVFGPQTLHRLPELIAEKRKSGISQVDISFPEIEKFDHLPPARVEGGAAYVSIMEGCSKYCSFCVVPYTRGEEVSRPFEDILTEVAHLAQQGVKELHLLGQNVNAYRGVILDGSDEGETADLATLLEYVHEIPGIERIRYTTSHPKEMTQRIIDCYRTLPKLCSQLHLPVQAGSDRVLVNMKRGYTTLEYKSVIRKLREARPDLCFSSDFIVGFPGETEEDFERTMKLIEDVGFDTSYSFVYSRRPGTPAADLPDDVPEEVKLARLQRMQKRLEQQAEAINLAMVGSIQRVMVERFAKKDKSELAGRTDNNRIVNFEGNPRLMNQFVHVKITDAFPRSLRGEIVTQEI